MKRKNSKANDEAFLVAFLNTLTDSLVTDNLEPAVDAAKRFVSNPELVRKVSDYAGNDITPLLKNPTEIQNLYDLGTLISDYQEEMQSFGEGGQFEEIEATRKVSIEDKEFKLIVAKTEEEKQEGLQGVESMDSDEGMLFDYSKDPQKKLTFEMKTVSFPIDIIFVDDEGFVISVSTVSPGEEKPIEEKNGPIKWVIELNANSKVDAGDYTNLAEQITEMSSEHLYVIGSDGLPQQELDGGERIFSRPNTKTLISMAKKAAETKDDADYKRLGRKIFQYIKIQDEREPEWVEHKEK